MKIIDHRLQGENIIFRQTENYYNPPHKTTNGLPDTIVIHYTAMAKFKDAEKVLATKYPKNNVSAHLLIGKKGEIIQLCGFEFRTWHSGKSKLNGRENFNDFSVGIEMDNVGWVEKYPDGTYSRPDLLQSGYKLQEAQVMRIRHVNPVVKYDYWEKYTEPQLTAVFNLCKLLCDNYGMKYIVGHDEISPDRKQDPGPAFPMEELRKAVLNIVPGTGPVHKIPKRGVVSVDVLNIRSGAGMAFQPVAKPLPYKTPVEILNEQDGWYRVRTQIEGWVSKQFISPVDNE